MPTDDKDIFDIVLRESDNEEEFEGFGLDNLIDNVQIIREINFDQLFEDVEVQEDHTYGWKIFDEPPFCVPFTGGTPGINVPVPEDPKHIDFSNMLFKNEMWTEIQ